MNGLKRASYIVFALVGVAVLAALVLPWVGPWQELFSAFIAMDWYLFALEILVVICAVGFLAIFIKGCVSKKKKDIVLLNNDGDEVRITRSAIASQATYLVEEDGTCYATKVHVRVKPRGTVDVKVYIQPHESMDVARIAPVLQKRLRSGLEGLCAGKLDRIDLSFTEPRVPTDIAETAGSSANEFSVANEASAKEE